MEVVYLMAKKVYMEFPAIHQRNCQEENSLRLNPNIRPMQNAGLKKLPLPHHGIPQPKPVSSSFHGNVSGINDFWQLPCHSILTLRKPNSHLYRFYPSGLRQMKLNIWM